MKRTEQTLFFHFNDRRLTELGRIAQELKQEGWEVLFIAARRQEDKP